MSNKQSNPAATAKKSFFQRCKVMLTLLSLMVLIPITLIYILDKPENIALSRIVPVPPKPFRIDVSPLPDSGKSVFKEKGLVLTEEDITAELEFAKQHGLGMFALPLKMQRFSASNKNAFAWAVQMGSFVQIKRANDLRKRILRAGYPAYIEKAPSFADKYFFRVRVGPEVDKARANQLRQALQEKFQMKTMLVPSTA